MFSKAAAFEKRFFEISVRWEDAAIKARPSVDIPSLASDDADNLPQAAASLQVLAELDAGLKNIATDDGIDEKDDDNESNWSFIPHNTLDQDKAASNRSSSSRSSFVSFGRASSSRSSFVSLGTDSNQAFLGQSKATSRDSFPSMGTGTKDDRASSIRRSASTRSVFSLNDLYKQLAKPGPSDSSFDTRSTSETWDTASTASVATLTSEDCGLDRDYLKSPIHDKKHSDSLEMRQARLDMRILLLELNAVVVDAVDSSLATWDAAYAWERIRVLRRTLEDWMAMNRCAEKEESKPNDDISDPQDKQEKKADQNSKAKEVLIAYF